MEALENKIKQNEDFARGFLEGFFGPSESQQGSCARSIHNALHWLDGWVEGNSRRTVGDFTLPVSLF